MVRLRNAFIAASLFASAALASAGVTNNSVIRPTSYGSMIPPVVGSSFVDPDFGTTIKRVSAARAMTDHASGGPLVWVIPEYSTPSLFNSDNSRFVLQHDGYFGVYDGSGTYLNDATYEMTANTQPRWSRANNNILYYQLGNQLKSYNVATGAVATVHAFTEYGAISGNGESDISWDGDHFVLAGDNAQIFVYTLSTGQKSPVLNTGGNSFDSMYIAADNKVTVTWNAVGTGRFHGIELFDPNMNFLRQLTQSGGHMDMSRDVNGDPVLVWTNANDPAAICQNGIVKIRLSDGAETCLAGLQLDWSLAVHISGSDLGWVVVSTYAPGDPSPTGNWPAYTNEIFRMKLDGSVVERLAHHRSRPFNAYNWQAWASINRDGTRILYGSNFGLQSILGYPSEYSDVYLINVGGAPLPTPPPTATPTPTKPAATPTATPTRPPTATPTNPPVGPTPTTPPAVGGHVEQTDPSVRFTGNWMTNTNAGHSGGSAALAMDAGSDATFTFTGTAVTWRGARDQWCGQADVYLDGVYKGRIDTYSASQLLQTPIWSASGLASGAHALRIVVTGTAGPGSSGAWVWVDSFDVAGSGGGGGGVTPTPTPSAPTSFYTVTPCRVTDTRSGTPLWANTERTFTVAGACGIPATAKAVSINVTVVAPTVAGDLRLYPAGSPPPLTSAVNFKARQTRAVAAVVGLNGGQLAIWDDQETGGTVHLVLDVNGYFQ
jgi:hypothetical protein